MEILNRVIKISFASMSKFRRSLPNQIVNLAHIRACMTFFFSTLRIFVGSLDRPPTSLKIPTTFYETNKKCKTSSKGAYNVPRRKHIFIK